MSPLLTLQQTSPQATHSSRPIKAVSARDPRFQLPYRQGQTSLVSSTASSPSSGRSPPTSIKAGLADRQRVLMSSKTFLEDVQQSWPPLKMEPRTDFAPMHRQIKDGPASPLSWRQYGQARARSISTVSLPKTTISPLRVKKSSRSLVQEGNGNIASPTSSSSRAASHDSRLDKSDYDTRSLPPSSPRHAPSCRKHRAAAPELPATLSSSYQSRAIKPPSRSLTASPAQLRRESDGIEALLTEHEIVLRGIDKRDSEASSIGQLFARLRDSQVSFNSILPSNGFDTTPSKHKTNGELGFQQQRRQRTTNIGNIASDDEDYDSDRKSGIVATVTSADSPKSNGTGSARRSKQRKPTSKLSPVRSDDGNSFTPPKIESPSYPAPPPLPGLLSHELPTGLELQPLPPLERYTILSGTMSALIRGSQATVQKLGNKGVRLKREIRARAEECRRYERKREETEATIAKLQRREAELEKEQALRAMPPRTGFFGGLKRRSKSATRATADTLPAWHQEVRELKLVQADLKQFKHQCVEIHSETAHHRKRIAVIEKALDPLEKSLVASRERYGAIRELEITLRSMRASVGLLKVFGENPPDDKKVVTPPEDGKLAAPSATDHDVLTRQLREAIRLQQVTTNDLKRHEEQYEKIIECEDHLNAAIEAAACLATIFKQLHIKAAEAAGVTTLSIGKKTSKNQAIPGSHSTLNLSGTGPRFMTRKELDERAKETGALRLQWEEQWKIIQTNLSQIKGKVQLLMNLSDDKQGKERGSRLATKINWAPAASMRGRPRSGSSPPSTTAVASTSTTTKNQTKASTTADMQRRAQSNDSSLSVATFRTAKSATHTTTDEENGDEHSEDAPSSTGTAGVPSIPNFSRPWMMSPTQDGSTAVLQTSNAIKDPAAVFAATQLTSLEECLTRLAHLLSRLSPLTPPRVLPSPLTLPSSLLSQHYSTVMLLSEGMSSLRIAWDRIISAAEDRGEDMAGELVVKMEDTDRVKGEWWVREGRRALQMMLDQQ